MYNNIFSVKTPKVRNAFNCSAISDSTILLLNSLPIHSVKATLHYVIYNIGFCCARAFSKHIEAITLSD